MRWNADDRTMLRTALRELLGLYRQHQRERLAQFGIGRLQIELRELAATPSTSAPVADISMTQPRSDSLSVTFCLPLLFDADAMPDHGGQWLQSVAQRAGQATAALRETTATGNGYRNARATAGGAGSACDSGSGAAGSEGGDPIWDGYFLAEMQVSELRYGGTTALQDALAPAMRYSLQWSQRARAALEAGLKPDSTASLNQKLLAALRLPPWNLSTSIRSYHQQVQASLDDWVTGTLKAVAARREYIAGFLAVFGCSLIEYDATNFMFIAFLLRYEQQYVYVVIRLAASHPTERPQIWLYATQYDTYDQRPVQHVYDNYPYSPRWSGIEMAQRARYVL